MRWIDFPPVAEFIDRSGVVRRIYGPTLMGRFEFIDRLGELQEILTGLDGELGWAEIYQQEGRLKNVIDRSLTLWGVKAKWLAPSQIEQLLFCRGDQPGWLAELMNPNGSTATTDQGAEAKTMAEAIAQITQICGSLTEAIELAGTVPGALLVDIVTANADSRSATSSRGRTSEEARKEDWIKANFDRLMQGNG